MTSGRSTYRSVLKRVSSSTPKKLNKVMQDVVLTTANKLIDRTPVDTGAAKYHWFLRAQPDEKFDKTRTDKGGALPKARAKRDVKLFKVGHTVFIVNAAPYFKYLENGSSAQAPSGVVAITIVELSPLYKDLFKVTFSKPAI